jgi:uncharacterized protein (UPF0335 family)
MIGHNAATASEDELRKKQVLYSSLGSVRTHKKDIASNNSEIKDVYARAKHFGISKKGIQFALTLDDKDANEVIADLEEKLWIARALGHPLGRQMDLLRDTPPAEEIAYEEGFAIGGQGKSDPGRYDISTPQGQAFQRGMNDGNELRNKAFADALDGDEDDHAEVEEPEDAEIDEHEDETED